LVGLLLLDLWLLAKFLGEDFVYQFLKFIKIDIAVLIFLCFFEKLLDFFLFWPIIDFWKSIMKFLDRHNSIAVRIKIHKYLIFLIICRINMARKLNCFWLNYRLWILLLLILICQSIEIIRGLFFKTSGFLNLLCLRQINLCRHCKLVIVITHELLLMRWLLVLKILLLWTDWLRFDWFCLYLLNFAELYQLH